MFNVRTLTLATSISLLASSAQAEVLMLNNKLAVAGVVEIQSGAGQQQPWRPEPTNGTTVSFALVRASYNISDRVRTTLSVSSGSECQAIGALRPLDYFCIQEANLSVTVFRDSQKTISLGTGSHLAPFGTHTIGESRTNNLGLLSLPSLTMPYTSLDYLKIHAASTSGRWSWAVGASTWNGAWPTDGHTAVPALYASFTVSPLNQTGSTIPNTNTNITGYLTILPSPHPLGTLATLDISGTLDRPRDSPFSVAAELHGGFARNTQAWWLCGTILPGIWLYQGKADLLVYEAIEGCKEQVGEGSASAIIPSAPHGGRVVALTTGLRLRTKIGPISFNPSIAIRTEQGPTAVTNVLTSTHIAW